MAGLIRGLHPGRVRENLGRVQAEIAAAARRSGRDSDEVEVCAATKYVPVEEMGALADAGITLVGENRQQDLEAKWERWGERLTFDFIGHLQSRKVKRVLPRVRLIHSVASDSVLRELARHASPQTEVLVEVNLSGEAGKSGVAPGELDAFLERCPVRVGGLMTMPPLTDDPQASRPYFARLRSLAAARGLRRLSMGTTQDFVVAVEEGATIVRVGTILYG
jgi:pyridoxal phosphate enzyme (YggS family)